MPRRKRNAETVAELARERVGVDVSDTESARERVGVDVSDTESARERVGVDVSDTESRVAEQMIESLGLKRETRCGLDGYTVVVDGEPFWIWEPIARMLFRGDLDAETLAQHIREMRASMALLESEGDNDGSSDDSAR
jgi:hypothetical protein